MGLLAKAKQKYEEDKAQVVKEINENRKAQGLDFLEGQYTNSGILLSKHDKEDYILSHIYHIAPFLAPIFLGRVRQTHQNFIVHTNGKTIYTGELFYTSTTLESLFYTLKAGIGILLGHYRMNSTDINLGDGYYNPQIYLYTLKYIYNLIERYILCTDPDYLDLKIPEEFSFKEFTPNYAGLTANEFKIWACLEQSTIMTIVADGTRNALVTENTAYITLEHSMLNTKINLKLDLTEIINSSKLFRRQQQIDALQDALYKFQDRGVLPEINSKDIQPTTQQEQKNEQKKSVENQENITPNKHSTWQDRGQNEQKLSNNQASKKPKDNLKLSVDDILNNDTWLGKQDLEDFDKKVMKLYETLKNQKQYTDLVNNWEKLISECDSQTAKEDIKQLSKILPKQELQDILDNTFTEEEFPKSERASMLDDIYNQQVKSLDDLSPRDINDLICKAADNMTDEAYDKWMQDVGNIDQHNYKDIINAMSDKDKDFIKSSLKDIIDEENAQLEQRPKDDFKLHQDNKEFLDALNRADDDSDDNIQDNNQKEVEDDFVNDSSNQQKLEDKTEESTNASTTQSQGKKNSKSLDNSQSNTNSSHSNNSLGKSHDSFKQDSNSKKEHNSASETNGYNENSISSSEQSECNDLQNSLTEHIQAMSESFEYVMADKDMSQDLAGEQSDSDYQSTLEGIENLIQKSGNYSLSNVSRFLNRNIESFLPISKNWLTIYKNMLKDYVPTNMETYCPPNKRMLHFDFIMPSEESDMLQYKLNFIDMYIDSSGSMKRQEIVACVSTTHAIAKLLPKKSKYWEFNSTLSPLKVHKGKMLEFPHKTGGTKINVCTENWLRKDAGKALRVICTDGGFAWQQLINKLQDSPRETVILILTQPCTDKLRQYNDFIKSNLKRFKIVHTSTKINNNNTRTIEGVVWSGK